MAQLESCTIVIEIALIANNYKHNQRASIDCFFEVHPGSPPSSPGSKDSLLRTSWSINTTGGSASLAHRHLFRTNLPKERFANIANFQDAAQTICRWPSRGECGHPFPFAVLQIDLTANPFLLFKQLFWHRTDLRLHDSPALHAALDLKPSAFFPVWCWDPNVGTLHYLSINGLSTHPISLSSSSTSTSTALA